MSLTMVEHAKLHAGNAHRSVTIELFPRTSPVFQALPFLTLNALSYSYNREESLPGVGFRGLNEGYTASAGVYNPQTETLKIVGGDLDVDTQLVAVSSGQVRRTHEQAKIKAIVHAWTATFFKGHSVYNPRGFDGLQARIVGDQLMDTNSGGAAAPLSLLRLDELISRVNDPTHLMMNTQMRLRLTAACRKHQLSGIIQTDVDAFGKQITRYAGLPIMEIKNDNNNMPILGWDEVAKNGTDTGTTSIYCGSFSTDGIVGLQADVLDIQDLGQMDDKPVLRSRIDWLSGFGVMRGDAAARIRGIKNAEIVE